MTDQAPPKKPKRPRDANQLARRIVDIATGDTDDTAPSPPIDPKKDGVARRDGWDWFYVPENQRSAAQTDPGEGGAMD